MEYIVIKMLDYNIIREREREREKRLDFFLFRKVLCFCELVCPKAPFNRLDLRPKGYKREALPWSAIRRPCTNRVSYVPIPLSRRGSKRVVTPEPIALV